MRRKTKKIGLGAMIFLAVILMLTVFAWLWLSLTPLTPVKERVFSWLPFPAAIVGGHPVSMKEFISRYRGAREFLDQQGSIAPANLPNLVMQRLIDETKLGIIASQHGAVPTENQITEEYQRQSAGLSAAGQGTAEQALAAAGLNDGTFKNELINRQVEAANLQTWFYGQRALNTGAYSAADSILAALSSGQTFEDLAKKYSQDPQTSELGGDNGFIPADRMLPEALAALQDLPPNQVKLVPTRYGLEIIKYLGQADAGGQAAYHLEHIFLQGGDFFSWYAEQSAKLRVIKIISSKF